MFNKLANNARSLLKEILESECPEQMLEEKFAECTLKGESELRAIIRDLVDSGLIHIEWSDNLPEIVEVNNSGRTYFEREEEYLRMSSKSTTTYNINASNSSIVTGNIINSTLTINNQIEEIKKEIEEKGGEEKEELKELLEEVRDMIDNMQSSRQIPKNRKLREKIIAHMDKHGWFYSCILSLLANSVIKLMG